MYRALITKSNLTGVSGNLHVEHHKEGKLNYKNLNAKLHFKKFPKSKDWLSPKVIEITCAVALTMT